MKSLPARARLSKRRRSENNVDSNVLFVLFCPPPLATMDPVAAAPAPVVAPVVEAVAAPEYPSEKQQQPVSPASSTRASFSSIVRYACILLTRRDRPLCR